MKALLVGVVLAACAATTLSAQDENRCRLQVVAVGDTGRKLVTSDGINYFAGGGVRLRCLGTRISMESDSVASYNARIIQFIGHMRYADSTLTMDADQGTYYKDGERWEARGAVKTRNLKNGSTLTGPSLDYFRRVQGVRDTFEMYAVGRPRIVYASRDSTGALAEPYTIVGDRVRARGDDRIWAGGSVTIDRSDFAARADSLQLDTGAGNDGTLVGGKPVLRGLGPDSFQLEGTRIDLALRGRDLSRIVARRAARVVNANWTLVADTIALDVNERKLQRARAWGDSVRPHAISDRQEIRADSLFLDTPGQKLREARAFGHAWVGGAADSTTHDRDWLAGETVTATFAQRDSAGVSHTVVRHMEARTDARSFYRSPDAKHPDRPSLTYARGQRITITMKEGAGEGVDRVDLFGKVDGVRLEPSSGQAGKTPPLPIGGGVAPTLPSLLPGSGAPR